MSLISKSFIESLQSIPLSDVADRLGVKLKGSGKNFKTSCISPSHEDKDPSFTFNNDNGGFKCHGCGLEGGGAIQFYAAFAGIDPHRNFADAVKGLADTLSMSVEYDHSKADVERRNIRDVLLEVTRKILEPPFFDNDKRIMREYCQERGLTNEYIQHAKLGFMPRNFHNSPLAKKNKDLLLEVGVIAEGENGLYTPLGGRLTLPITDEHNRVIALAGRTIREDQKGPKYRNTSESSAFKKSKVLYGLAHALAHKPERDKLDRIYVVEGYFDVITAQLNGYDTAVGTMGTAVTLDHLRTLSRHAKGITFVFDPDAAGLEASRRALLVSLSFVNALDIRFAFMPTEGDRKLDPDVFLRSRGPQAFRSVLDNALELPAFAAKYVIGENPGNNLAALLLSGIEERGRDVYQSLPPGISRELLARHIAAEVSKPLNIQLDPKHLGMRIDTELAMAELHDLAYGRVSAEDSPTPFSDVLNGDTPGATREKQSDEPVFEPSISAPTEEPTSDSSKPASEAPKTKSLGEPLPAFFRHLSLGSPVKDGWIVSPDGHLMQVTGFSSSVMNVKGVDGEPRMYEGKFLVVTPEKVVRSKFPGPDHKKGDLLLLLANQWVAKLPGDQYVAKVTQALSKKFPTEKERQVTFAGLLAPDAMVSDAVDTEKTHQSLRTLDLHQLVDMTGLDPTVPSKSVKTAPSSERGSQPYRFKKECSKADDERPSKSAHQSGSDKPRSKYSKQSKNGDVKRTDNDAKIVSVPFDVWSARTPKQGDWMLLPSGELATLTAHGLLGVDNRSVDYSADEAIVILPKTSKPSKFDNAPFKKGDTILLLGTEWVFKLTPKHHDLASDALALSAKYTDCQALLAAAHKDSSVKAEIDDLLRAANVDVPSSELSQAILDTTGISHLIEPTRALKSMAELSPAPEGLLFFTKPKEGDFVTSSCMNGQIYTFREGPNGAILEDPDTHEQRPLPNKSHLLVVKPERSMRSKMTSSLASEGQHIFKLTRNAKTWHRAVPANWIAHRELELGKSQASNGPAP